MKAVFFDVDTQIDFLYPAGALYVPGAETIVNRIAGLNRYAASQGIPVISTLDAHSENDPEFRDWPPHCVAGTAGQQKPAATLLEKRDIVPNRPGQADFDGAQQILLEKQALDCFTNVNLPALLDRFGAQRYVVYGVVTEICVRYAALGLLKTGARVEIVTDAVCSLSPEACAAFLAEFTAAGGVLVTAQTVQSGLAPRIDASTN
ncbi:MAG TPA: isochorismatase family cysteine hydrolase [Bryobacteraceae bacterium]|nr:isochorismatase family cysteine hydrolase [Bryobacteraceae bacterium]